MSLAKAYRKGTELKQRAMDTMNLTPREHEVFRTVRPIAMPKEFFENDYKKIEDLPPYEVLGSTTINHKKRVGLGNPFMFIREDLPVVPELTMGNLEHLPDNAWVTERDLIGHEMGHAKDYLSGLGSSSEESASDFAGRILSRNNNISSVSAPPSVAPLGRAYVQRTFNIPLSRRRNGIKLVDRPRHGMVLSEDKFRMEKDEDYHY